MSEDKKDLARASLVDADLRKANLEGANLQGANFSWANFQTAHFSYANFRDTDLSRIEHDENTIWPRGYKLVKIGEDSNE